MTTEAERRRWAEHIADCIQVGEERLMHKEYEKARESYREALRRDPDHAGAKEGLLNVGYQENLNKGEAGRGLSGA